MGGVVYIPLPCRSTRGGGAVTRDALGVSMGPVVRASFRVGRMQVLQRAAREWVRVEPALTPRALSMHATQPIPIPVPLVCRPRAAPGRISRQCTELTDDTTTHADQIRTSQTRQPPILPGLSPAPSPASAAVSRSRARPKERAAQRATIQPGRQSEASDPSDPSDPVPGDPPILPSSHPLMLLPPAPRLPFTSPPPKLRCHGFPPPLKPARGAMPMLAHGSLSVARGYPLHAWLLPTR
jgi:hypothetical protein